MILRTIHVKNFKCVKDSEKFKVEESVTCLVGKNESGKTALLQALEKINPLNPERAAFVILEYPRAEMVDYQDRMEDEPANYSPFDPTQIRSDPG